MMHSSILSAPLLLVSAVSAAALHLNLYSDGNCGQIIANVKVGTVGKCHVANKFLSVSTNSVDQWFFGKNIKLHIGRDACDLGEAGNLGRFDLTNKPNCYRLSAEAHSYTLMNQGTVIHPN
jgi:hypothetical protein